MKRQRVRLPPLSTMIPAPRGPVILIRAARIVNHDIECDGLWESDLRRITIRTKLSRERAWWVFFHERSHVELDDAGVALDSVVEEAVCDAMATARMAEFYRTLTRRRASTGRSGRASRRT